MIVKTDTTEKGFEELIVKHLVEVNNYEYGESEDFNKEYAIDEERLWRFIRNTQPEIFENLNIDQTLERSKFLTRLSQELSKVGIIQLLRKGFKYLHYHIDLYNATPNEQNLNAVEAYEQNIFSVIRQVRYSKEFPSLALDFALFINGLPVMTFELKNQFTKQNVEDAVHQYRRDRDPKELIFHFKRCAVHFAVDDVSVKMCTKLAGKESWFLPFNKGTKDNGAGNDPNPNGIATDYLWKEILSKESLSNIIENFAQVVEEKQANGKIKQTQIFPRYHQLKVVRDLLEHTRLHPIGQKYLIQHSAGSGKSNSIAWLSHQLVVLEQNNTPLLDSVIVVTDRVNLDKQIKNTIRQFMQESATVAWADSASVLREHLQSGKKIIITTVHKFPYILDGLNENRERKFAIIIDEAHSSQNGSMSAKMNQVLSGTNTDEENLSIEDKINNIIEGRKMLSNANYYAFTATPKNKTLEMFGVPFQKSDGSIGHRPFHNYSMKQAIEESFIMDVLERYTPIQSFYRLAKSIEDDPQFDKKRSEKKLRYYVESNYYTIEHKASIMMEHFHTQVISKGKIGGQARAMVITSSIERAIDYYHQINKLLVERNSPYKTIIAFSGDKEYRGKTTVNEASMNGFASSLIETKFKEDPYRILIVADKFQTGFDEPLLHTMYVDKSLSGIRAVQTLSRLNRAHPKKKDTFVLDFSNDPDVIQKSFQDYYKSTILSSQTDPNKLNDLISTLEKHQIYNSTDINNVVELIYSGAERDQLDPILDQCTALYKQLDEDGQVNFKGSAKSFIRTYTFLAAILPFGSEEWEKLSIFLTFLLPKLPSPISEDLSKGILESIDFDSYKNVILEERAIRLENQDSEVAPVPVGSGGSLGEPEVEYLSAILNSFNTRFGDINWTDSDKVRKVIKELPAEVAKSEAYQNAMKNSDKQTAKIESDAALKQVIISYMTSNMELFKNFQDNSSFKKWLEDYVFQSTYNQMDSPMRGNE